jgi:hypothetical protein
MGIALHHLQGLVARDTIDRDQINACLYEVRNGRLAQGMKDDLLGIKASGFDHSLEGFEKFYHMASLGLGLREEKRLNYTKSINAVGSKLKIKI